MIARLTQRGLGPFLQPITALLLPLSVAVPVVLYGLDPNNKPQAARFPERLCDLAIKAAQQLKLSVLKITTEEFAQVAGRLPVGRVNSTGKGLVPNVNMSGTDIDC